MNATATPNKEILPDFDNVTPFPGHLIRQPEEVDSALSGNRAEEELTGRILQDGRGRGLLQFCRELSVILIRRYMSSNDAGELRDRLSASLMVTLDCSEKEAFCLIDLALELIHVKVYGDYRRSNVDLGYLVENACQVVNGIRTQ